MAYVRAALSIEGVLDPLPPPVNINAPITLRLAFSDAGGAAVPAADATLEISRPDGVELEVPTAAMTAEGTGVWLYTVLLDQGSQWRFRAAGAGAASADLPVTVVGSALSPALPTGPILVDEIGLPLALPEGVLLTLVRVDRLEEAEDPAGLNLIAVVDGQSRRITWETLEAAAAAAGGSDGSASGAAAGTAAGAISGAEAGEDAGAIAGTAAGTTAGAAAAQPFADAAEADALAAAASAAAGLLAEVAANAARDAAAISALTANGAANGVTASASAPAGQSLLITDPDGNIAGHLSSDGTALLLAGTQLRRGASGSTHIESPAGAELVARDAAGLVTVAGIGVTQLASETISWAITDLDSNLLFGVNRDGTLLQAIVAGGVVPTTLEGSTVTQEARDDGVAFAFVDADRNLGLGVRTTGTLVAAGVGVLTPAQLAAQTVATDARIVAKVVGPVDGRRLGCNGDSITDYGTDTGPDEYAWNARGWAGWIGPLTGWRIVHELADNMAITGSRSSGILSRAPALAAGGYGWIGQHGGATNDAGTETSPDDSVANLIAAYEIYLASGARVIATPILPRRDNTWGAGQVGVDARKKSAYINAKMGEYARNRLGMVWADPRPLLVDPATGDIIAAAVYDNLHTSPYGAYIVARSMAEAMSPYLPAGGVIRNHPAEWDAVINPLGNLLTNGYLLGTGGTVSAPQAGVVPGSWETGTTGAAATGGTVTWSKENPRTDGQPGERLVLTVANLVGTATVATYFVTQTVLLSSGKYAPGDVIELTAEVDKAAGSFGVQEAAVRLTETDGVTAIRYAAHAAYLLNHLPTLAYAMPLKTPRFVVRPYAGSGTASIEVRVGVTVNQTVAGGASVSAAFGRVSLNKVA